MEEHPTNKACCLALLRCLGRVRSDASPIGQKGPWTLSKDARHCEWSKQSWHTLSLSHGNCEYMGKAGNPTLLTLLLHCIVFHTRYISKLCWHEEKHVHLKSNCRQPLHTTYTTIFQHCIHHEKKMWFLTLSSSTAWASWASKWALRHFPRTQNRGIRCEVSHSPLENKPPWWRRKPCSVITSFWRVFGRPLANLQLNWRRHAHPWQMTEGTPTCGRIRNGTGHCRLLVQQ